MPTPFPGMDPYLERPGLWDDVHAGLIVAIQQHLDVALRPDEPALPLNQLLHTLYDRAGYELAIDDRSAAEPPRAPANVTWAATLLG